MILDAQMEEKDTQFPADFGEVVIVGNGEPANGAVLYTKQKLTEEQQAQARANISAVQQGTFGIIIQSESGRAEIEVYDVPDDTGHKHTILRPLGYEDGLVVLTSIAEGVNDFDAATVGQLKAAVGDISTALDSIIAIQEELIGGESA